METNVVDAQSGCECDGFKAVKALDRPGGDSFSLEGTYCGGALDWTDCLIFPVRL